MLRQQPCNPDERAWARIDNVLRSGSECPPTPPTPPLAPAAPATPLLRTAATPSVPVHTSAPLLAGGFAPTPTIEATPVATAQAALMAAQVPAPIPRVIPPPVRPGFFSPESITQDPQVLLVTAEQFAAAAMLGQSITHQQPAPTPTVIDLEAPPVPITQAVPTAPLVPGPIPRVIPPPVRPGFFPPESIAQHPQVWFVAQQFAAAPTLGDNIAHQQFVLAPTLNEEIGPTMMANNACWFQPGSRRPVTPPKQPRGPPPPHLLKPPGTTAVPRPPGVPRATASTVDAPPWRPRPSPCCQSVSNPGGQPGPSDCCSQGDNSPSTPSSAGRPGLEHPPYAMEPESS